VRFEDGFGRLGAFRIHHQTAVVSVARSLRRIKNVEQKEAAAEALLGE
jgi:hypothetical protein